MLKPEYHSLLPREAQDALIAAATAGEKFSAERAAAVKAATSFAISKAPDAFKPLHERAA